MGVVGTRFWRAPEILRAVKRRNIDPELFTKSADVYSYGMTCYEIVTGRLPFEDLRASDFDVVIRRERPKLPKDIKPWMRDLITRCWHPNPLERPTFKTILDTIQIGRSMGDSMGDIKSSKRVHSIQWRPSTWPLYQQFTKTPRAISGGLKYLRASIRMLKGGKGGPNPLMLEGPTK